MEQSPEKSWSESVGKQVPNWLTVFRLLLVPVFVVLMNQPGPIRSLWATAVFIAAALTDWLDGYLARLFKAESILGTVLDPLADKILVMAALVMLVALPESYAVPGWMVVLLLAREMIITGLRSLAAINHTVVPASRLAKHKTVWTFIAIVFLLMGEPFSIGIKFHTLGLISLWIGLGFSIVSGFQYAYELRRFYR